MKSSKDSDHTRKLTVSRKYVASQLRNGRYDPKILIAGQWLSSCGFNPGHKIVLKVSHQKIVIEQDNNL